MITIQNLWILIMSINNSKQINQEAKKKFFSYDSAIQKDHVTRFLAQPGILVKMGVTIETWLTSARQNR